MYQSKWEFYWLRNKHEGASVQMTLWWMDGSEGGKAAGAIL